MKLPEYGRSSDPAINRVLLGRDYLEYKKWGGTVGIDNYINYQIKDPALESIYNAPVEPKPEPEVPEEND
jgi:hypothetical protein